MSDVHLRKIRHLEAVTGKYLVPPYTEFIGVDVVSDKVVVVLMTDDSLPQTQQLSLVVQGFVGVNFDAADLRPIGVKNGKVIFINEEETDEGIFF